MHEGKKGWDDEKTHAKPTQNISTFVTYSIIQPSALQYITNEDRFYITAAMAR